MIRYERRFRIFAMSLSALAGFVDATAFVLTGGLFVSFMSGNSTRMAVSSIEGSAAAILAPTLIGLFLAGVVGGGLVAASKPSRRKSSVLALSTAGLLLASGTATFDLGTASAMLMAFAMGALNNVFLREGEVSIGVTYMTGTLVRAGQRIAARLRGEGPSDWLPYLLLWVSLVGGAFLGALLASLSVLLATCVAATSCGVLTWVAHWLQSTHD